MGGEPLPRDFDHPRRDELGRTTELPGSLRLDPDAVGGDVADPVRAPVRERRDDGIGGHRGADGREQVRVEDFPPRPVSQSATSTPQRRGSTRTPRRVVVRQRVVG